jgi:DNA-binding transcriptional MerR regulator
MQTNNQNSYSIGVVARRAQIHPQTLRVWEKRYGMISPLRTESGRRIYSEGDILKVSLVKQLTELGHPVSDVADLSIDALRERLNGARSAESLASPGTASQCRVVFSSPDLRLRFSADLLKFSDMAVAEPFDADVTAATNDRSGYADVLVSEMSTIDQDSAEQVQKEMKRAGCVGAVVIFNFGTRWAVAEVSNAGIVCLKGPVAAGDIRRACVTFGFAAQVVAPRPELPPRRFTASQLVKLEGMGGSITCECPNHLAEMITSLCAFEKYSRECANRNDEDARVHAQLEASTAQARAILEESLARLIEIEGIVI